MTNTDTYPKARSSNPAARNCVMSEATTFQADTPRESGWYFATNDPDDPTNQSLGWWDAGRKVFTAMSGDDEYLEPHVTAWKFDGKWWRDGSGMWTGPKLWHGPIVADWKANQ